MYKANPHHGMSTEDQGTVLVSATVGSPSTLRTEAICVVSSTGTEAANGTDSATGAAAVVSVVSVTVLLPSVLVTVVFVIVVTLPSGLFTVRMSLSVVAPDTAGYIVSNVLPGLRGFLNAKNIKPALKNHKRDDTMARIPALSSVQLSAAPQISDARATYKEEMRVVRNVNQISTQS